MIDRCPPPEDLLDAALARRDVPENAALRRHMESCDACATRVRETRALLDEIQSLPRATPSTECLSAEAIASVADGAADPGGREMSHAAQCATCRARITAVARLVDDPSVASEFPALLDRAPRDRRARRYIAFTGLAAAAAAALVLVGPTQERLDRTRQGETVEQHREPQTGLAVPQIVSPPAIAAPGDSLRWTDVPQADLYRVRIWDADGTVVWAAETRATTAMLPALLQPGIQYMWDVSARTGWDRWVSSDLAEVTLRAP